MNEQTNETNDWIEVFLLQEKTIQALSDMVKEQSKVVATISRLYQDCIAERDELLAERGDVDLERLLKNVDFTCGGVSDVG